MGFRIGQQTQCCRGSGLLRHVSQCPEEMASLSLSCSHLLTLFSLQLLGSCSLHSFKESFQGLERWLRRAHSSLTETRIWPSEHMLSDSWLPVTPAPAYTLHTHAETDTDTLTHRHTHASTQPVLKRVDRPVHSCNTNSCGG